MSFIVLKEHSETFHSILCIEEKNCSIFKSISVILLLADLDRRSLGPWRSEVTGLYEDDYSSSPSLTPLLPPQAYLSLEGQNGEEAGEENIVYL